MRSARYTGSPGSGSARSSPRPCTGCAIRPDPTSSGTFSTDLPDGGQPKDITSDTVRPADGRTECPDPDGRSPRPAATLNSRARAAIALLESLHHNSLIGYG